MDQKIKRYKIVEGDSILQKLQYLNNLTSKQQRKKKKRKSSKEIIEKYFSELKSKCIQIEGAHIIFRIMNNEKQKQTNTQTINFEISGPQKESKDSISI